MLLEDQVVNPSLLTKTVSITIEKGILRSGSIIVDATHTLSKPNPITALDMLRERYKRLRKTVYTYDEH